MEEKVIDVLQVVNIKTKQVQIGLQDLVEIFAYYGLLIACEVFTYNLKGYKHFLGLIFGDESPIAQLICKNIPIKDLIKKKVEQLYLDIKETNIIFSQNK